MERQKLQRAADTAVSILKENLKDYTFCFPGSNSENQF